MRPEETRVNALGQLAGKPKPADLARCTLLEIKYDGHRIYAYRDADRVRIFARSGAEKSGLLRSVEAELMKLPVGTWLDGEACSFKADGTNDWGVAQQVLGSDSYRPLEARITYVVFDVLEFDSKDTRALPLRDRRAFLDAALAAYDFGDCVQLAPQWENSEERVAALIAQGFEGAIVKDPGARYASGKRGAGWFKVKATWTADVVLMGATEGKGKFLNQVGALVFGQYDAAGALVEQGQCSGMDDAERARFTAAWRGGELNGVVVEIAHMGVMPTGGLRHPQFKRIRTDKAAADCTIADQAATI